MANTHNQADQFKEYTPVVGRHESTRWVAPTTSYDGNDWGDEYSAEEDNVGELQTVPEAEEPEEPPKPLSKPVRVASYRKPVPTSGSSALSGIPVLDKNGNVLPSASSTIPTPPASTSVHESTTPHVAQPTPTLTGRVLSDQKQPQPDHPDVGYADEQGHEDDRPGTPSDSEPEPVSNHTAPAIPHTQDQKDSAEIYNGQGYHDSEVPDHDAHSIKSEDLSVDSYDERESQPANDEDGDYRDIYGYYGERQSHPYNQLTRESGYFSDSTASLSTGPRSVESGAEFGGRQSIEYQPELEQVAENPIPDEFAGHVPHTPAVNNDSESAGTLQSDEVREELTPVATPKVSHDAFKAVDNDNNVSHSQRAPGNDLPHIPAASAGAESLLTQDANASGHRRQPSHEEQQAELTKQILGSLSPSHSRQTSGVNTEEELTLHDPELAALYQGTSEFLARPISVYDSMTPPLNLRHDESMRDILDPKAQERLSSHAEDPAGEAEEAFKPPVVPSLEVTDTGLNEKEGERPRWVPDARKSNNASGANSPQMGTDAEASELGATSDSIEDDSPKHVTIDNKESDTPHISLTEESSDVGQANTSGHTDPESLVGDSSAHDRQVSISQISTFSDNPALANESFGVGPSSDTATVTGDNEANTEFRSRSGTVSSIITQQAQISAKVKRPPVVDFGALLKGGDSETRLTQLFALKVREAEYTTGLDTWLSSTYSDLEDSKNVFTAGLPPSGTIQVPASRQVSSAVSHSSTKTKDAMVHLSEKSTAKAKSLFAKGRKFMRSSTES